MNPFFIFATIAVLIFFAPFYIPWLWGHLRPKTKPEKYGRGFLSQKFEQLKKLRDFNDAMALQYMAPFYMPVGPKKEDPKPDQPTNVGGFAPEDPTNETKPPETKSDFKVGTKVRIRVTESTNLTSGQTGVVIPDKSNRIILVNVKFDNSSATCYYSEQELEIIDEPKDTQLKVGDWVKVLTCKYQRAPKDTVDRIGSVTVDKEDGRITLVKVRRLNFLPREVEKSSPTMTQEEDSKFYEVVAKAIEERGIKCRSRVQILAGEHKGKCGTVRTSAVSPNMWQVNLDEFDIYSTYVILREEDLELLTDEPLRLHAHVQIKDTRDNRPYRLYKGTYLGRFSEIPGSDRYVILLDGHTKPIMFKREDFDIFSQIPEPSKEPVEATQKEEIKKEEVNTTAAPTIQEGVKVELVSSSFTVSKNIVGQKGKIVATASIHWRVELDNGSSYLFAKKELRPIFTPGMKVWVQSDGLVGTLKKRGSKNQWQVDLPGVNSLHICTEDTITHLEKCRQYLCMDCGAKQFKHGRVSKKPFCCQCHHNSLRLVQPVHS